MTASDSKNDIPTRTELRKRMTSEIITENKMGAYPLLPIMPKQILSCQEVPCIFRVFAWTQKHTSYNTGWYTYQKTYENSWKVTKKQSTVERMQKRIVHFNLIRNQCPTGTKKKKKFLPIEVMRLIDPNAELWFRISIWNFENDSVVS